MQRGIKSTDFRSSNVDLELFIAAICANKQMPHDSFREEISFEIYFVKFIDIVYLNYQQFFIASLTASLKKRNCF